MSNFIRKTINEIDDKTKYNEYLTDKGNSQIAQKIIERLSFLHFQQKDINETAKKNFREQISSKLSKASEVVEFLNVHREIILLCQTILTSTIYIQFTMETMNTIWINHKQIKNDAKQLFKNNKSNLLKLKNIQNHINNLQVKKEILNDDLQFYRNYWNLNLLENDENVVQYENEIWSLLTTVSNDASVPENLMQIDDELFEDTINTVESNLRIYLVDGRVDENIGSVVLKIAKRCIYLKSANIGLRIINMASEIFKKCCNENSIKLNLFPIAQAFSKVQLKNYSEAVKFAKSVYENISLIDDFDNIQKYYLKFQIAYFLVRWNSSNEGFSLLEETVNYLENYFPETEVLWRTNTMILVRLYNEFNKSDAAYDLLENLLNKYHVLLYGPISSKNRPIYEMATDLLAKSNACSRLMEKVLSNRPHLPPYLMDAVRELIIVFAIKRNFNAVRLLEHYLIECIESHKMLSVYEEEIDDNMMFNMIFNMKMKLQKAISKNSIFSLRD